MGQVQRGGLANKFQIPLAGQHACFNAGHAQPVQLLDNFQPILPGKSDRCALLSLPEGGIIYFQLHLPIPPGLILRRHICLLR